jgi:predicted PurR-regulated permease PerM
MRTSLVLLVAVIVVLITALVVLAIFAGGMQNISQWIKSFFGGQDTCEAQCNAWQFICEPGSEPKSYSEFPNCADRSEDCICGRKSGGG